MSLGLVKIFERAIAASTNKGVLSYSADSIMSTNYRDDYAMQGKGGAAAQIAGLGQQGRVFIYSILNGNASACKINVALEWLEI